MGNFVQIVKGEDKTLVFKLINAKTGAPYNLAGYTGLSASFLKADDSTLTKAGTIISSDAGAFSVALSDTETALLRVGNRQAMYLTIDKGTEKIIVLTGLDQAVSVVAKPF